MKRTFLSLSLSALVAFASACDGDAETADVEANGAENAEGQDPEVTYALTLNDWLSAEPIEGVTVCTDLTDVACVTSDANGLASITARVADGQVVEIRLDVEGYFPVTITPVATNPEDGAIIESTWVLAPLASLNLLTGALGVDIDDAKGQTTLSIVGPANEEGVRGGVVNATVSLDLASDAGPKYLNAGTELTTLGPFGHDEDGSTAGGPVGFFNVEPGVANFTVTAPGLICGPGISGSPSESGSVSGTIVPGRVSYFFVACEEDTDALVEVTSSATISDWASGDPLEGVSLCVNRETEDCLTSDAEGKVETTAMVADGQVFQLRADKEGYFPFFAEGMISEPTGGDVLSTVWVMAEASSLDLLTAALEGELDEEKGHVTMLVFGPAGEEGNRSVVSGATVTTDKSSDFGPKYLNALADWGEQGVFGDDTAGTTAVGTVSFFNVSLGRIDFSVNVEGHVCGPGIAGLPSANADIASHVEAGRATYLTVNCEVAED